VPEAEARENVRRRFTKPRAMVAVEEQADFDSRPLSASWPETVDELYVVRVPASLPANLQKDLDLWLAAADHAESAQPVAIRFDSGTIRWRAGRAVLQAADDVIESLLSGLIDFAYYESELRRLEYGLLPYEKSAIADVELAYRIRQVSQTEWPRLCQTMENLSRMRFAFAAIEPYLSSASRALDREARRVAMRLAVRSELAARLESFSDRLEACEDLYEGAVDRVADFRSYRRGELLEVIIIVLLAMELIAMILSLTRLIHS